MRSLKMGLSIILLGAILCQAPLPAQAEAVPEEEIVLIIDNALYTVPEDQPAPMIINDRVYVPLRLISTALGFEVQWQAESKQVVIGTMDPASSILPSEEQETIQIVIDGQILETNEETGQPFLTESGFTMLPLRVVGDALNCEVTWEPGVVIVSPIPQPAPVITPADVQQSTTQDHYGLSIFGEATATKAQMEAFLASKESALRQKALASGKEFHPYPENIAGLYLELGKKYNIRGDIAFAQACKETGYFQFQGSVEWFQNNYCGLGATGIALTGEEPLNGVDPLKALYLEGMHGITFTSPAVGVEAHLQHLYAYACSQDLPAGCAIVDPRFIYVQRGVSPRWIDLDGHWAIPGDGYGESILDDYWKPMLQF